MTDPFGGTSRLSYDAQLFPHVVSLDSNPLVSAVTCERGGIVSIRLSNAIGAEAFAPGIILAGSSEAWSCTNDAGVNMPFTKGVIDAVDITLTLRNRNGKPSTYVISGDVLSSFLIALSRSDSSVWTAAAVVGLELPLGATSLESAELRLRTEDVPPTHCFERMTLDFHRTAGSNEAELRRQLHTNDTFANEVYSKLGRRLDLGDWGKDFLWERSLIKMNFDSSARAPIAATQSLLGNIVYCANCVSAARHPEVHPRSVMSSLSRSLWACALCSLPTSEGILSCELAVGV